MIPLQFLNMLRTSTTNSININEAILILCILILTLVSVFTVLVKYSKTSKNEKGYYTSRHIDIRVRSDSIVNHLKYT
jgi:hypothetical protein